MRRWLWLALLTGCEALSPACVPVEPEAPAQPVDDARATCDEWRRLGCEEGEPTAKGASCEDVTRDAEAEGIDLTPPLGCLRSAATCDQMRRCEIR